MAAIGCGFLPALSGVDGCLIAQRWRTPGSCRNGRVVPKRKGVSGSSWGAYRARSDHFLSSARDPRIIRPHRWCPQLSRRGRGLDVDWGYGLDRLYQRRALLGPWDGQKRLYAGRVCRYHLLLRFAVYGRRPGYWRRDRHVAAPDRARCRAKTGARAGEAGLPELSTILNAREEAWHSLGCCGDLLHCRAGCGSQSAGKRLSYAFRLYNPCMNGENSCPA